MSRQAWVQIAVNNADFLRSQPNAGMQTGSSDMVIFGGETAMSFTLDIRNVNMTTKQATVALTAEPLDQVAHFSKKSDFVGRVYRNTMYVIDATDMQLYVY